MRCVSETPKRAVRRTLRARRSELVAAIDRDREAAALSAHLLGFLTERLGPGSGARIAAYESTPAEPPTERLLADLTAAGYDVVVPITNPDWTLDWKRLDGTVLGVDALRSAPVVLAPGLAVDRTGTRLGQGGGCYDRTLADLPEAYVVVLLHDGEVSEQNLPRSAYDIPVHAYVTAEAGVCRVGDPNDPSKDSG